MDSIEAAMQNKEAHLWLAQNAEVLAELSQHMVSTLTLSGSFFSKDELQEAFKSLKKMEAEGTLSKAFPKDEKGVPVIDLKLPENPEVYFKAVGTLTKTILDNSPSRDFGEKGGVQYSTNELLEAEQRIFKAGKASAEASQGKEGVVSSSQELENLFDFAGKTGEFGPLGADHRRVVEEMLESSSDVQLLSGPPGSGKSTVAVAMRDMIVKQAHDAGQETPAIYVTSPSSKATQGLMKDMNHMTGTKNDPKVQKTEEMNQMASEMRDSLTEVSTTGDMIQKLAEGNVPKGSFIIVDEAGLMGSKEMADLLETSQKAGVRLVMFGDALQIPPKEAGNGFDLLLQNQEKLGVHVSELFTVLRQGTVNEAQWTLDFRESNLEKTLAALQGYENRRYQNQTTPEGTKYKAVLLEDGKEEGTPGLQSLEDKGAVYGELTKDFIEYRTNNPSAEYVVMGTDNASAKELSEYMHKEMVKAGMVTDVRNIGTAEKPFEVGIGDTLTLTEKTKAEEEQQGKQEIILGTKENDKGEEEVIKLTPGSQCVVTGFEDGKVSIVFGGDTYQVDQNLLCEKGQQGLALSMHQAQGQSQDRAFLAVDKTGYMDQAYGGVAFSRHKKQMSAYVSETAYPTVEAIADEMSSFRTRQKLLSNGKGEEILKEDVKDLKSAVVKGLQGKISAQQTPKKSLQSSLMARPVPAGKIDTKGMTFDVAKAKNASVRG